MGCEVEDLERDRLPVSTAQTSLSPSMFYCLIQSVIQTHKHKRVNTPLRTLVGNRLLVTKLQHLNTSYEHIPRIWI